MGAAKAELEWHGSTLLRRTVGVLARAVSGEVVVVAAPGQCLPALPPDVTVVRDDKEGRGPLEGIAAGLTAAQPRGTLAFVCSTDLPHLHPAFVACVLAAMDEMDEACDAVVPHLGGYRQPLLAVYRTALAAQTRRLVTDGVRSPGALLQACRTCWLAEADLLADLRLAAVDPGLRSVVNLNDPGQYAAARAAPAPRVTVERDESGYPRRSNRIGDRRRCCRDLRAATLAAAAEVEGVALSPDVVVALNGRQVPPDPELPLVEGDHVRFRIG